jgi:hypothetical protein
MKELYPNINSAASILECTKGRGHLMGSFVEHTKDTCSYHGELLGLMAVHHILLAINKCNPGLPGSAQIFSDCLGALNKIENLPPYCIPTRCSHSENLKNIMVHCSDLSFRLLYSHMKAHQDDSIQYGDLPQPAQLNCQMDYHAKTAIWDAGPVDDKITRGFPLEPVCVFLGRNKLTSDKGEALSFWVNRQIARKIYHELDILYVHSFDKVDWECVHSSLQRTPRMFQIWACKQVMGIAPANANIPWDKTINKLCPSCAQVHKTCSHILFCDHAGRIDALMKSIDLLKHWLTEVDTNPELLDCIVEYARGQGGSTMTKICYDKAHHYQLMAADQHAIGWRHFMEGMVCRRAQDIQTIYHKGRGLSTS